MSAAVGIRGCGVSPILFVAVLAAHVPAFAQTKPPTGSATARVEKFTATAMNPPGEPFTFRLSRWSTDADRDRLSATFSEQGVEGVREALAASQTLGYIWTSEPLGYSVRYAYRTQQPDGSTRIIIATDRPLDLSGAASKTKASDQSKAAEDRFTVIELRLNRNGVGEGRSSKIGADPNAKTIALENYEKATVILKDVKEERAR